MTMTIPKGFELFKEEEPLPEGFELSEEEIPEEFELFKEERSFRGRITSSLLAGEAIIKRGELGWHRGIFGEDTPEDRNAIREQTEIIRTAHPDARNILEKGVLGAAEMFPLMADVGTEALMGATVAGGAVAIIGAPIPGDEIITVPIAAGVGAAAMAGRRVMIIEGGNAYADMIAEDIEPHVAKPLAIGVGALNALIEVSQLRLLVRLVPGSEKFLKAATRKAAKRIFANKSVKKLLLQYGGTVTAEAGQESVQEVVQTTAREFGKSLKEGKIFPDDIVNIVAEDAARTFIDTFPSFMVLGLPFAMAGGVGVVREGRTRRVYEKEKALAVERIEKASHDAEVRGKETLGMMADGMHAAGEAAYVDWWDSALAEPEGLVRESEVLGEFAGRQFQEMMQARRALREVGLKEKDIEKNEGYIELRDAWNDTKANRSWVENEIAKMKPRILSPETAREIIPKTKIVDEEGNPLIVYHGTQTDAGLGSSEEIHFGTAEAASQRTHIYPRAETGGDVKGIKLIPAYLDMKKPLGSMEVPILEGEPMSKALGDPETRKKYDGIIYRNDIEDTGSISFVIFKPEQMKPAFQTLPSKLIPGHKMLRQADKATTQQKGQIHKLANELKLSEEERKALQKEMTGVESAAFMSKTQARQMTNELERRLGRGPKKQRRPKKIGSRTIITPKQEVIIASRKNNAIKEGLLTEQEFQALVDKHLSGKQPRYVPNLEDPKKTSYVTEKAAIQFKRALERTLLINELSRRQQTAVEKNPQLAPHYERLKTRISLDKGEVRDPHPLDAMRYWMEQASRKTGRAFSRIHAKIVDVNHRIQAIHANTYKKLEKAIELSVPGVKGKNELRSILGDRKAQDRISQWLSSHLDIENAPERPFLSNTELAVAEELQTVFESYEWKVRARQIYEHYWHGFKIPAEKTKNEEALRQIEEAKTAFQYGGLKLLRETVKEQTWGVIESGYDPWEIVHPPLEQKRAKLELIGKSRLMPRGTGYAAQDKTLFSRLNRYMRQMDTGTYMQPYLDLLSNEFETAHRNNEFDNPRQIQEALDDFAANLKGFRFDDRWIYRMLARAYGQAALVVIRVRTVLGLRNLFQNPGLYVGKADLVHPDVYKKMPDADYEYFSLFVDQTRALDEWLMGSMAILNEVPGFRKLNQLAEKINIYPWSDRVNRLWCFKAKSSAVRRAVVDLKEGRKSVEDVFKAIRLDDITPIQQQQALEIWASEGDDAFARFIARVTTEDVHFLYARADRSPTEMPEGAKTLLNLFTFPRSYAERMMKQANKVLHGKTRRERIAGAQVIGSMIVHGIITGALFSMLTGRRSNPYNPIAITGFELGALALRAANAPIAVMVGILKVLDPQTPEDLRKMAWGELSRDIPQMADMYIPLYIDLMNVLESATGMKSLDRLAVRRVREMIDSEYNVRGGAYEVERTFFQSIQHIVGGAGVDQAIREAEAEKVKRLKKKGLKPRPSRKGR